MEYYCGTRLWRRVFLLFSGFASEPASLLALTGIAAERSTAVDYYARLERDGF